MKSERVKAVKVKPGERFQKALPKALPKAVVEPVVEPVVPPTPALDLKISEMTLRAVPLSSDEFPVVAAGLNYKTTIGGLVSASAGGGITGDTGEPYKVIMLSNGTVRAIPVAAVVPIPPTGLVITVRLSSVNVSWASVIGAVRYNVYRATAPSTTMELLNSTTSLSYRDTSIVVDNTYEYRISTVDQYGQISPRSDPVFATTDLALNNAPTDVEIRVWPTPIPTDGPAFIRVNANEIDIQIMSFLLNVDAGSIRATNDPSLWIITV